jgi:hypothetical protein
MRDEAGEYAWLVTRHRAGDEAEAFLEQLEKWATGPPWQASLVRLESVESTRSSEIPRRPPPPIELAQGPAGGGSLPLLGSLLVGGTWGALWTGLFLLLLQLPRRTPPPVLSEEGWWHIGILLIGFLTGMLWTWRQERDHLREVNAPSDDALPSPPPPPMDPVLVAVKLPAALAGAAATLAEQFGGEAVP